MKTDDKVEGPKNTIFTVTPFLNGILVQSLYLINFYTFFLLQEIFRHKDLETLIFEDGCAY